MWSITGMGTVNALHGGRARRVAERARLRSLRHRAAPRLRGGAGRQPPRRRGGRGRARALVDAGEARRLSRICRLTVAACASRCEDAGGRRGPGLGLVVGIRARRLPLERGVRRRVSAPRSRRTLADDLPEHGHEHDGVRRGDRGRRARAVGDDQPGDRRRRPGGGARRALVAQRQRGGRGGGRRGRDLRDRLSAARANRRAVADGGRGPEGCRPYRGGSQRSRARRGRDVPRARGAGSRARARRDDPRRDRGLGLGQRARARPTARRRRLDRGSPGGASCSRGPAHGSRAATAPATAIPRVDDWERALLARDLGSEATAPMSLAPRFGQHGGLGALRVAAAALDAAHAARAGARPRDRARRLPARR